MQLKPQDSPSIPEGDIAGQPASGHVTRDVILLIILSSLFIFPSFGRRDLWNPDEPRYTEVGREMVFLNDYTIPHLNGQEYPDKPPVFFWLVAAFWKLGLGVNAGRMAAGLASIGTVLATYFIGRRLLKGPGPLMAAVVTLTCFNFAITAKSGVIDPLLTFFVVSAIGCGLRAMEPEEKRRNVFWLACYALTGIAVLTKGPVAIMVPFLSLAAYKISVRKKARAGGWIHLAAPVVILGIACAWFIPAYFHSSRQYIKDILVGQTEKRLMGKVPHGNPFYMYAAMAPAILFPWILIAVPAVGAAFRDWRRNKAAYAGAALCWFFVNFVVFSAITGKRAGYILPLFPAFGIMVGAYLAGIISGAAPWPRLYKALAMITLTLTALIAVAAIPVYLLTPRILAKVYPDQPNLPAEIMTAFSGILPWLIGWAIVSVVIFLWGYVYGFHKGRPLAFAGSLVSLILLLSLVADVTVVERLNGFKSGKQFCLDAEPWLSQATEIHLFKKDFAGVYNLYSGRVSMPIIADGNELAADLAKPDKVAVIGRDEDLYKAADEKLVDAHKVLEDRVGHRKMYLLVNWKLDAAQQTDSGGGLPGNAAP